MRAASSAAAEPSTTCACSRLMLSASASRSDGCTARSSSTAVKTTGHSAGRSCSIVRHCLSAMAPNSTTTRRGPPSPATSSFTVFTTASTAAGV